MRLSTDLYYGAINAHFADLCGCAYGLSVWAEIKLEGNQYWCKSDQTSTDCYTAVTQDWICMVTQVLKAENTSSFAKQRFDSVLISKLPSLNWLSL